MPQINNRLDNPDWNEENLGVSLEQYQNLPTPLEPEIAAGQITLPECPTADEWLGQTRSKLLVIDGHSLAFRAFYALRPDGFLASDGEQHTNAVYGFISVLARLLRQYRPDKVAVAFDVSRYSFRSELYPEYKEGRRPTPQEFKGQIDLIKEILEKLGVVVYAREGHEADDYLASLAVQGSQAGYNVMVCSGDRDSYQLINNRVVVLYPGRAGSDMVWTDSAEIYRKYQITPEYYPEVAALSGEQADNLPGVPGVGEKIAIKWLKEFGNLTELLKHREHVPGKRGQLLRENLDNVVRNRYLNRLRPDLELHPSVSELECQPVDVDGLRGLFDYLGFGNSLRERLQLVPQLLFAGQSLLEDSTDNRTWNSSAKSRPTTSLPVDGPAEEKTTNNQNTGHAADSQDLFSAAAEDFTYLTNQTIEKYHPPTHPPLPKLVPVVSGIKNLQTWFEKVATQIQAAKTKIDLDSLTQAKEDRLTQELADIVGIYVGVYHRKGKAKEEITAQSPGELVAVCYQGEVALIDLGKQDPMAKTESEGTLLLPELDSNQAQLEALADFCQRVPFITYNWKTAAHRLAKHQITLPQPIIDVQLVAYLCDPATANGELEKLAEHTLGLEFPEVKEETVKARKERETKEKEQAKRLNQPVKHLPPPSAEEQDRQRALELAQVIPALAATLWPQLVHNQAVGMLKDLEVPIQQVLYQMEQTGIAVCEEVLSGLAADFTHLSEYAQSEARRIVSRPELNLASPAQLQEVLFEQLDMPKTKKTKKGYTTNAESLEQLYLLTTHPFLEHLLSYRDSIKLLQIVQGLQKANQPDGRIHTSFQQTVTATGRLSSIEPNLQNIPARTEVGQRIRSVFVRGSGYENLMSVDYSQIEMRIMAHLSEDEALIAAINQGEDLHRSMAAMVFGIPDHQVDNAQRSQVKATSYGLAYGLSAYGLSQQLKIEVGAAKRLMDKYFDRFGKVQSYLNQIVIEARGRGYTETMFGRRRYLPELQSDNRLVRAAAERAALNAPIQGSAADLMKLAMLAVESKLRAAKLESRMLLQIHDELILEIAAGEETAVTEIVTEAMTGAAKLSVPLAVGVGIGPDWHEAAH